MDEQEDKEDFEKLINDLQYYHNDDDDRDYVPGDSDIDDYKLGS